MKRRLGFVMAVMAAIMLLTWTGPVQAYQVTGDVTSGWGTTGGDLWYSVLKETAGSTAGGYDDATPPPVYGVMVRPPTTTSFPNPINPTNHNWVEVNYILVTGRDGHRALYSVGEIDPRFGNKPVTLTLNRDKRDYDLAGAGREVKKAVNIDVVHAFTHMKSVVVDGANDVHPFSPALIVSGAGIKPQTYDLDDLKAMPQVTFDASSSTSNTKGIWKGPTLKSVLEASGVDTRDMDSYIIVQATDGYATLLSMYEVTHKLGLNNLPNTATCPGCVPEYVILGISDMLNNTLNNGTCTDSVKLNPITPCRDGGLVRTINPGDLAAGRWVSNASQIIVYKLDREEFCDEHDWHR